MEVKNNDTKDVTSKVDDALAGSLDTATVLFEKYRKQIYYVGGGILIVVALIVGYKQFYIKPLEEEAQKEIFMAQKFFEKDSLQLALNGVGQYKGMVSIAEEYGSTKTGNLAKYYAGMSYLRTGKYNEAIEYLSDFSTSDELIGALAQAAIGDAHVELNEYDEAAKYFIKASKMIKNKFTTPVFLKKAGLVYEELKQYGKAVEVYELIKKDFKDTQEGQEMDKYIARARTLESNS